MRKKLLSWILTCSLVVAMSGGLAPTASAEGDGDFTVVDGVLTVYTGSGGAVVIPENLGITALGDRVFYGRTDLTSVTIPANVQSIGTGAFYSCTSLNTVSLSYGLKTIGDSAFDTCTSLVSMTIPGSVTSMGNSVFYNCTGLESVTVPASVESIGTNIFQNCTALKTVTLSEGLASIGQMAFYNCKKLISLVIPPSVTEVGTSAFTGTGITAPIFINNGAALCYVPATYSASYEVPSDVTSIVGGAFYNCADLTSVTLPGGLTAINGSTFRGCTGLQSITIPENVESIGGNAFFGCAGLQTVTIPGNVSSIGDYAFFSCTNLASVTVPESVTSIGIVAFSSCSDELIIHGASGSYAETYAAEYDIIFSDLNGTARSAVTFSKNDGGPAAESTYYIAAGSSTFYTAVTGGSAHTLAAPARTDYVFGGWYQEAACDNQIMTGAPVLCADTDYTDSSARWTPAEAVTLYAKWLEKTPAGLGINYEDERITGLTAGTDYGISGTDVTADGSGETEIQSIWFGTSVTVVKKGVSADSSFDSAAAELAVPAHPAAPAGLTGVNETCPDAGDGGITGVDDTMEYRLATTSEWTSVGSGAAEITGLPEGTYYVRYKAVTSGSPAFASAYAAVTVATAEAPSPEAQPAASADYENEKLTGLTAEAGYGIGGTDYTADGSGKIAIEEAWFGTTVGIVKKGNGTTTADSTAQSLTLAARPEAPASGDLTVTQPTGSVSTGTIAGITSAMSYSADGGSTWTAGTGGDVSGLAPGSILIRLEATASAPKSGSLTVTITAYQAPSDSSGDSGGSDDSGHSGDSGEDITIAAVGGRTVTGTLTGTETGVEVTIGGDDFSELAGSSRFGVKIDTGSEAVVFNQQAADYIAEAAGSGNVVLTIDEADPASLSALLTQEDLALIGNRPVYEFTLTADGAELSDFGGSALVSVPYTLQPGENALFVMAYYIDASGSLQAVRGFYNPSTGMVTFRAQHFSRYAVGYNPVTFADVDPDAWYCDAVGFIAARCITTGVDGERFAPEAGLTRAQFLVMLMRAYGLEADDGAEDNFDDAGNTWYTGYLAAARARGITRGVGGNRFAPEAEITRQDMFTLIYRVLDSLGELPESDGAASLSDFSDADEISDYAREAMEALVQAGVVSGSGESLDPTGTADRAQMAQVLYRLLTD